MAYVIPTRQVVAGFGEMPEDDRWVLIMEWVAEERAMWFVAALVAAVAAFGSDGEAAVAFVYRLSAGFLVVVGAWTALTGARGPVIWFKLCPVARGTTAGLLVAASLL